MRSRDVLSLFILISIALIAICGFVVMYDKEVYQDADTNLAVYEEMEDNVFSKDIVTEVPNDSYSLSMSFDVTKDNKIVASDVDGWLYIPNTPISYIVMRGTSEEPNKYLWKDPYGESSRTGSLFVQGIDTANKIVFGHRLKNHDIYFGPLLNFRDKEYATVHNYAYYVTEDTTEYYQLYAVCEGREDDMVYSTSYITGTSDYAALIEDIDSKAIVSFEEFDVNSEMLVLSTCSGNRANQPDRLYLVYQRVD